MKEPDKIILDALGDNSEVLSISILQNESVLKEIEKKLLPLFNQYRFSDYTDLVTVGYYLYSIGKTDYKKFNKTRNYQHDIEADQNILNHLIEQIEGKYKYKIQSIRIDYTIPNNHAGVWEIKNQIVLHNVRETLKRKFSNPFWIKKRKKISMNGRAPHKPYGLFLKHWIKALDHYLQDKIFKKKDRYFFIGQFLKVSGMPLVSMQGKSEGQEIPEKKYFDNIRKTYL